MNSPESLASAGMPSQVAPSGRDRSGQLRLSIPILGLGHIVSFKNSKMILPARGNRRAMLITDPKKQRAMNQYTRAIEHALSSAYRTIAGAMPMAPSLPSWIASSVPLDDSLDWIPESDGYRVVKVPPGNEGIIIFITKIT